MLNPAFHRITAWLCLVVALLTGVAPAQGFVLCVEEDGCVSVELTATSGQCVGCDEHAVESVDSFAAAPMEAETICPCSDFAVPGSTKDQSLRPKAPDAPLLKWLPLLPTSLAPHVELPSHMLRAPTFEVPRALDTLCLIRSVVLVV